MRFRFTAEQTLPHPPSLVFAFFANPQNLPHLLPYWRRARIEQASYAAPPPRPEGTPHYAATAAGPGSRITFSFRILPFLPIRLPWEALIEDFVWNESFSDVQIRGPFKSWRHTHTIQPTAQPGVIVSDAIDYELPFGPFSALANTLFIRPLLAGIFNHRQHRTAELLAAATTR
jgi:ligand-binding SRPBCC domain-containing protein